MFSATVPVNSSGSWGTKATRCVHQARSTCDKGSPATVMTPDVGLRNPRISCARVDLPAPEGPITPSISPGSIVRSTSARAGRSSV